MVIHSQTHHIYSLSLSDNHPPSLETLHKRSLAESTLQELHTIRLQLSEELNVRTRIFLVLNQRIYYEHGNKVGRLLARTLKSKKTLASVDHIQDSQGNIFKSNQDIAA